VKIAVVLIHYAVLIFVFNIKNAKAVFIFVFKIKNAKALVFITVQCRTLKKV